MTTVPRYIGWIMVATLLTTSLALSYVRNSSRIIYTSPRLELPSYMTDLGKGKPGEILTGSFRIKNPSNNELTYDTTVSCGCTELNPRKGVLKPGEVRFIKVGIQLGEANTKKDVHIVFTTNDVNNPTYNYVVFAESPAQLVIQPTFANFGAVKRGDSKSQVVTITVNPKTSIDPSSITILLNDPNYAISNINASINKLTFDLQLLANATMGSHNSLIIFKVPKLKREFQLPIMAEITTNFIVIPQVLNIQSQKDKSKHQGNRRLLGGFFVKSHDKAVTNLAKVISPPSISIEKDQAVNPQLVKFNVFAADNAQPSTGVVHMYFEGDSDPVQLKLIDK